MHPHAQVAKAKKQGLLIPQPCQKCGSTKHIHAHHEDYSKPLDVVWLCSRCHRLRHCEMKPPSYKGWSIYPKRVEQCLIVKINGRKLRKLRIERQLSRFDFIKLVRFKMSETKLKRIEYSLTAPVDFIWLDRVASVYDIGYFKLKNIIKVEDLP